MSFWTSIRDAIESPATLATGIVGAASSFLNNNDSVKDQNRAVNEQIKAYKDQTALTKQQLDQTRSEQDVERRRIQEKQIRSLRSNYRPAGGLLGIGNPPTNDTSNQLGS